MDEIERMKKAQTALEIALKKSETYQHRRLPNPNNELQTTRQPVLPRHTHAGGLCLGEALQDGSQTGKTITLGVDDLFAGLHVLGVPRHGKTALLINLFLQLAEQGYGAAYIDPHSDAISDILARLPAGRADDVLLLDPTHETHSFPLQLLTCDNVSSDTALTYAYNQLWSVSNKVWADKETGEMGIWMQKFVSNSILTFLEHPGYTVADIPLLLTSKPHREYFAKTLKNSVVARFWTEEFEALPKNYQWVEIESTLTRLNRFLQNPLLRLIVGQSKSTLNFRHIMDTKKLLLVHFPVRLPEDFRTLLGTMLITQLQDAMFSRSDTPKPDRVPFFLIVDEVQEVATKQFTKFFEEGGKYHVATIAAHQHLFQEGLSVSVRNGLLTAGNKVYLRTNDTDAEIVAPGFAKAPEPEEIPYTIPANVLEHLDNSEQLAVQAFSQQYVDRMRRALGRKPRYDKEWGLFIQHTVKIQPEINFGEGLVTYNPDKVLEAWYRLNALVFEACHEKTINEGLLVDVLYLMAPYLRFPHYYNITYATKMLPGPQTIEEEIRQLDERIAQEKAMVSSDRGVLELMAPTPGNGWWPAEKWKDYLHSGAICVSINRLNHSTLGHTIEQVLQRKVIFTPPVGRTPAELYASLQQAVDEYQRLSEFDTYAKWAAARKAIMEEQIRVLEQNIARGEAQLPQMLQNYYTIKSFLPRMHQRRTNLSIESLSIEHKRITGKPLSLSPDLWYWWQYGIRPRLPLIGGFYYTDLAYENWDSRKREYNRERRLAENIESYIRWTSNDKGEIDKLRQTIAKEQLGHGDFPHKEVAALVAITSPEQIIQQMRESYLSEVLPQLIRKREKLQLKLKRRKMEGGAIEVIVHSLIEQDWRELNRACPRTEEEKASYFQSEKAERWEKAEVIYHQEKAAHNRFVSCLRKALVALTQKPILVVSAEYRRPSREKTEREMIDTAARQLRNLPKYQAFCKLVEDRTTAVYHIALPPLPSPHKEEVVAALTKRVWSRMETDYYRTKVEIEEEIVQRQKLALPDMSAFAPMPARQRKQGNGAKSKTN